MSVALPPGQPAQFSGLQNSELTYAKPYKNTPDQKIKKALIIKNMQYLKEGLLESPDDFCGPPIKM